MTQKQTMVTKNADTRRIVVVREFDAPPHQVWAAWTTANLLDKWWAPRPWQAKTKTLEFAVGGHWLYCMEGPDGSRHWSLVDFLAIDPQKTFAAKSCFCDAEGLMDPSMPVLWWNNTFEATASGAKVTAEIHFDKDTDYEKILQMGFQGGFTMALGNLDELLQSL